MIAPTLTGVAGKRTSLRRFARFVSGTGFPVEAQGKSDLELPFFKVKDLKSAGHDGVLAPAGDTISRETAKALGATVIPRGSLVLAKVGAALLLGRVGVLPVDGCIDNNMAAVVFTDDMDPDFARYVMSTFSFGRYVLPGPVPSLDMEAFREFKVPALPIDEQRAIADYLDHETGQVDRLVAKQEEFIGLLRERRSRAREVLADRVTVGARLRWMLREIDHRVGSRAADLPLFSVSIDWGVRRRDETTDKLSRAEDLSHYKVCLEGDIVVNRMRAFQGALGVAPADGIVSPDYAVLRAAPGADPSWLVELMRTKAFIGEITLRLRGIGGTDSGNVRTPRINTADLLDIRADVPDVTTQGMELTNLVAETTRIDALTGKTKEHMALAKERRSALITAAVTGQIDVRTARKAA